MKLGPALWRFAVTVSGLGVCVASIVAVQACSGDSDKGDKSSPSSKTVPAEQGGPTTSTEERVFAIDRLHVGEADRAGNASSDAWKKYGYDLDGRVTSAADSNSPDLKHVCKRVQGAPARIHQDGDQGTDNAFGKEIVGILEGAGITTPSRMVTDAIQQGTFTIMLKVVGLTDEPAQTNTGLSGTVLIGTPFSDDPTKRPTFTTADDWPYRREPQVAMSGSYITDGVFVNGKGGSAVNLTLSIAGRSLSLGIRKAIISFKHNPVTKALDEGTIAGVLDTEELITGISAIAGSYSRDLCTGPLVESLKTSVRQASDILADGTQDPDKSCDGISVGIGFSARQVGSPTRAIEPGPPPPDPCEVNPDAGTGDGG